MSGYELSRQWFDFAFANVGEVSITQTAVYMWLIEFNNRKNWTENFRFNSDDACDAIGAKDAKTVWKAVNELAQFGFVKIIYKSNNRHEASILSIVNCVVKSKNYLDQTIVYQSEKRTSRNSVNVSVDGSVMEPLTESKREVDTKVNGASLKQENKETENKETKKQRNNSPAKAGGGNVNYNYLKNYFLAFFLEKFNTDYYFTAKDASATSALLKKINFSIEKKCESKGVLVTDDLIQPSIEYFVLGAYEFGSVWIKENFTLSTLNSKYPEIMALVQAAGAKQMKSRSETTSEILKRFKEQKYGHS